MVIGQGTAPEADSFVKLSLLDGAGELLILIQTRYRRDFQQGKETLEIVLEEYEKAKVEPRQDLTQLFVFSTDAEVSACAMML